MNAGVGPCCNCCVAAAERGELDHEIGAACPYPPCDYCQPPTLLELLDETAK